MARTLPTALIGLSALVCVALSAMAFVALLLSWFTTHGWLNIAVELALIAGFGYGYYKLADNFVNRVKPLDPVE